MKTKILLLSIIATSIFPSTSLGFAATENSYSEFDPNTWAFCCLQEENPESLQSDTTPPAISILSPENKTYSVEDVSLTLTVSEPTSWMGYSLDGQENRTIGNDRILYALSDGSHSLIVYAKDAAGNTGASETVYFTIETPESPSEPVPPWILTAILIVASTGIVLTFYFMKVKRPTKKAKS